MDSIPSTNLHPLLPGSVVTILSKKIIKRGFIPRYLYSESIVRHRFLNDIPEIVDYWNYFADAFLISNKSVSLSGLSLMLSPIYFQLTDFSPDTMNTDGVATPSPRRL